MKRPFFVLALALVCVACTEKKETETLVTEDTSSSVVQSTTRVDSSVVGSAVDSSKPVAADTAKAAVDPAAAGGKTIFYLSKYGSTKMACADCHSDGTAGTKDSKLRMGNPLHGVTKRPSTWNGEFKGSALKPNAFGATLCARLYQNKMSVGAKDIEALNAYFASLETNPGAIAGAIPVDWVARPELKSGDAVDNKAVKAGVKSILRMPGDAGRGAAVYTRSCGNCHGLKEAKIGPALENGFADVEYATRAIRMGTGTMPFYSRSVLTDQQVADVIAYIQENLQK